MIIHPPSHIENIYRHFGCRHRHYSYSALVKYGLGFEFFLLQTFVSLEFLFARRISMGRSKALEIRLAVLFLVVLICTGTSFRCGSYLRWRCFSLWYLFALAIFLLRAKNEEWALRIS